MFMILPRLLYAKSFFLGHHAQVGIHVTFPTTSPQKEPHFVYILAREIVRTQAVIMPTLEFHQVHLCAQHSDDMDIVRKDPAVPSDMFMNVLTSAIQVNVLQKDVSCLIAIKQAL